MVPKADSGAFLLLFLLVLTVTEPLRPGARRGGGAGGAAGGGARSRSVRGDSRGGRLPERGARVLARRGSGCCAPKPGPSGWPRSRLGQAGGRAAGRGLRPVPSARDERGLWLCEASWRWRTLARARGLGPGAWSAPGSRRVIKCFGDSEPAVFPKPVAGAARRPRSYLVRAPLQNHGCLAPGLIRPSFGSIHHTVHLGVYGISEGTWASEKLF